jgi:hypothetical protein
MTHLDREIPLIIAEERSAAARLRSYIIAGIMLAVGLCAAAWHFLKLDYLLPTWESPREKHWDWFGAVVWYGACATGVLGFLKLLLEVIKSALDVRDRLRGTKS